MTESAFIFRKRLRSARGFTLIELLVVCLIAGILGGAMLGLYEGLVRSWANTNNRIVNQDDARTAINEIARYVRMAESSASNLTSQSDAIMVAQPQELVFYADIDGNGLPERVRYYLSSQTLWMATVAPSTATTPPTYATAYSNSGVVVMNGIRNGTTPMFTYYEMNPAYASNPVASNDTLVVISNPTSAADLASIVAVGVTLYVNEAPALSKGNVSLDTLIQIRQRYNGGLSGS